MFKKRLKELDTRDIYKDLKEGFLQSTVFKSSVVSIALIFMFKFLIL